MENKRILIVEDNPEEARFALEQARNLGLETKLVDNFGRALEELGNRPDYIISDLFFPGGDINQEPYIKRILPAYETYLSRFEKKEPGVLNKAIVNVSNVMGTTPEKYVEEILPLLNNPKRDVELSKDAVYGIKNYSQYEKLQELISEIKQGKNLPYGLFLVEEAKGKDIPISIVTSVNHHNIAFEPIRNKINTEYYDGLVNERKNWKAAFDEIQK
jgi:hypothetical protein